MLACIVSIGAVDVSSWVLLLLLLQLLLLGNSRRPTPTSLNLMQSNQSLDAIKLIRSGEIDRYEKSGGTYHIAGVVYVPFLVLQKHCICYRHSHILADRFVSHEYVCVHRY